MGDVSDQQIREAFDLASAGTLPGRMGIKIVEASAERVVGTMPVAGNIQPYGLLHGGASVTLAETLGSVASLHCVDQEQYRCVGQEINANHVRAVAAGVVTATARPFHLGSRSHVWHIEIRDESERLVCVSRLTMAVIEHRPQT